MCFVKGNGLLIRYALNKLETFSIQCLSINQNPLHIEISQIVISSLQTDSAEISRRKDIDIRFGQAIHKWCHTGYHLIIQLSVDLKLSGKSTPNNSPNFLGLYTKETENKTQSHKQKMFFYHFIFLNTKYYYATISTLKP